MIGSSMLGRKGQALRAPLAATATRRSFKVQSCLHNSRPLCLGRVTLVGTSALCQSASATVLAARSDKRIRSGFRVYAVAAPSKAKVVVDKEYPLPSGFKFQVKIENLDDGSQSINVRTNLQAGRLLLHWGVEGGNNYKGGWRLPGQACWPAGTSQYKDRALQSPFKSSSDGWLDLDIALPKEEASDVLDFVLKDAATNTWYDHYGTNFAVPLHFEKEGRAAQVAQVLSLPDIPQDLCNIWAYLKWEHAGSPNRSADESEREYRISVDEMTQLLSKGHTVEDLWQVARGDVRYAEFIAKAKASPNGAPAPSAPSSLPVIPQELVNIQAYLLWERNGKPNGADFGPAARAELEKALRAGKTLGDIALELKAPPKPQAQTQTQPPQEKQQQKEQQKEQQQQQAPPAPAAASAPKAQPAPPAQVGRSLGAGGRDPLALIKRAVPQLATPRETSPAKPLDFLVQKAAVDPTTVWRRLYPLGSKAEVLVVVRQPAGEKGPAIVSVITDTASPVVLHWAMTESGKRDWVRPSKDLFPENTVSLEAGPACESRFLDCQDDECDVEIAGAKVPLQRIQVALPEGHKYGGLTFVLRSEDSTMWWKDSGSNFFVPLPGAQQPAEVALKDPSIQDPIARAIIDCETQSSQWTLMHRFNKAADLLNEIQSGQHKVDIADATSRIFIWLRYSATRQLTWQRNYNTQPRILSAAQDRLTGTIANAHAHTSGEAQEWVRLMLGTVGRGGDGQKIRDEILNIMHRNHIPEKKGLWMEEWHQKLHNNTTPDDVPICEAYIAFLESNGDRGTYWRVLSDAGITRQRLESYDRPVIAEPDHYPDKKQALINDFRNYLGILRAVHSGADLQASAAAAGGRLPASARGWLGYVLSHLGDSQILPLLEAAVEARTEIAPALPGCRELLYLDLALEDQVRQAAERGAASAGFGAAAFMAPLLQNLALTVGDNEEICFCLKAWNALPGSLRAGSHPSREDALLAVSVVNRIRRALADISDSVVGRIASPSLAMGRAFGCESWAVDLFAEEVVRGGPAFAVSLAISSIEPVLRTAAALGAWQVISPSEATGVIEVVDGLYEVMDNVYDTPTVLVAKHVSGEEEIPEGCVAVLTPDAPDVLSHVSVRARNMRVLFATCHDDEPLDKIRAARGKWLTFKTSAAGAVTWTEAAQEGSSVSQAADGGVLGVLKAMHQAVEKKLEIKVPVWCGKWAVGMDEYTDGVVGAKSKNLAGLRGKLPDWINLPASVTLPFSCFEQVLELPENQKIKEQLAILVKDLEKYAKGNHQTNNQNGTPHAQTGPGGVLAQCRKAAMQVKIPAELRTQLTDLMKTAGIPVPQNEERWKMAEEALKGVWASKYNDRAFYSMRKAGLDFNSVRMAVLVQRVVPAHYAYVIHTKNPSNNDEREVFCELVLGLGESLVSGMVPGSSLAFKALKDNLDNPEVLSYASKSEGMFVRESLIFRSDSNGEDLEGYAGAGLYESITMDPTENKRVDYIDDRLVKDPGFRRDLLSRICKVGAAIESALGSAQDVEGVVAPDGSITVVQTRPQV